MGFLNFGCLPKKKELAAEKMSKRILLFLFLALTSLLAGSGNCYARSHTIVHEGLDLESPLHKVGQDIKALDKMIFTITIMKQL